MVQEGYAVVFLHRASSRLPFLQHSHDALECLVHPSSTGGGVDQAEVLRAQYFTSAMAVSGGSHIAAGSMLLVPFTTIQDYLHLLRSVCESSAARERDAMLVLASAVSDFYLPRDDMSEHKIQSAGGNTGLEIHLKPVPKALEAVRTVWSPHAFVVSFKLETDRELLATKAVQAIDRYGVHVVVANLLADRYSSVALFADAVLAPDDDTMGLRVPLTTPVASLSCPRVLAFENLRAQLSGTLPVAFGAHTSRKAARSIISDRWVLTTQFDVSAPRSAGDDAAIAPTRVSMLPHAKPLEDALVNELIQLHSAHRRQGMPLFSPLE